MSLRGLGSRHSFLTTDLDRGNRFLLPPIRIHVGEDEVLLDDARRYVAKAVAAGVDARVEVWQGMLHVFPSTIGQLAAAETALVATGAFLADRLSPEPKRLTR